MAHSCRNLTRREGQTQQSRLLRIQLSHSSCSRHPKAVHIRKVISATPCIEAIYAERNSVRWVLGSSTWRKVGEFPCTWRKVGEFPCHSSQQTVAQEDCYVRFSFADYDPRKQGPQKEVANGSRTECSHLFLLSRTPLSLRCRAFGLISRRY